MAIKFLNSVAVDTDVLFVDTANERVGIGTTNPKSLLEIGVSGTLGSVTNKVISTIIDGGYSTLNSLQYNVNAFIGTTYGTSDIFAQTSGEVLKNFYVGLVASNSYFNGSRYSITQGGAERLTVAQGGNVGIGTTGPSQKLHIDGNARITGAYYDSGNTPGTVNQLLASTATGTAWIDPSTIVAEAATLVVIACKNTSGAAIAQGTPVYQTGTVGATATIEIAPADALISANKLPAIGLLQTALNNNGFGNVVITGELTNFTTDPIDGLTPTTGDKIFVKSGGGLTLTKPTGEGNGIQNMGLVGKVSGGNAGSITVSSIMRTNDVPNLPEGRIWVGDSNTIVSDTVYIDEPNGRMGIGTTAPSEKLDVSGNAIVRGDIVARDTYPSIYVDHSGTVMGGIRADATSKLELKTLTTAPLSFQVNSSEKMRILDNGNVGIGTTSPGTKLHISAPGGSSQLTLERTGGGAGKAVLAGAAEGLIVYDDLYGPKMYVGTSGTYNGNVGIGTISPTQKLHVDGNTLISAERYYYTAGTGAGFGSDASGNFKIRQNDADLIFGSGNNVGIGTTNPSYKLDVDEITSGNLIVSRFKHNQGGVASAMQLENRAGAVNSAFDINWGLNSSGNQGTVGVIRTNLPAAGGSEMYFKTSYGEVMRLDGAGKVGIGTTSPDRPLSVVGGNSMVARFQSTNTTSFIQFSNTVSTADQVRIGSNGNNLVLSTNYAERMRITSAGDTGIGVTTPRAKLDVAGGIKVADDTDTAGANKVGTLRYRTSGNNSYVDMCMQTGASTYAWINVVQNNW